MMIIVDLSDIQVYLVQTVAKVIKTADEDQVSRLESTVLPENLGSNGG